MVSTVLFSLTVIKVICIYIKNKRTCEEEALLCQNISTVAENMDLLKVFFVGWYRNDRRGLTV